MKTVFHVLKYLSLILFLCTSCARQPRLPENSRFSVTALRNDSTWFATGKGLRLIPADRDPGSVKQFNLRMTTDIPFPGRVIPQVDSAKIVTGCVGNCRPSQDLLAYNIPMRKGKYKIAKLDKRRTINNERSSYWLVGYSGGASKAYYHKGRKPGWIRITNFDKSTNVAEGRFAVSLDEDLTLFNRLINEIPPVARFREGLFRVKVEDVKLKK
ncbi:hypothetical protein [Dyadobacter psychrotolerans]|uniref:Lipoprotein n=1 Tax=Dyadobacter psychrotolerans TaxID=2541721 RepID=A0A4R5DRJ5_9BACT|nr:hypothetical protein [Dyadobacter psychrotolerans]TDE14681.1 hypothetical protein E0F88_15950 [Dyadobacter psychrotolerans]